MSSDQENMFGEPRTGGEQRIELAGLLELIESAEGSEDALADAAIGAGVFDDLQIPARSGWFDAEEHGDLGNRDTTIITGILKISREYYKNNVIYVALHFPSRTDPNLKKPEDFASSD